MDLLKYLEPMKNLPERFSNLAFWRGVRKLRDEVVNAFEYVDSWGENIESTENEMSTRLNSIEGSIDKLSYPTLSSNITSFPVSTVKCTVEQIGEHVIILALENKQFGVQLSSSINLNTGNIGFAYLGVDVTYSTASSSYSDIIKLPVTLSRDKYLSNYCNVNMPISIGGIYSKDAITSKPLTRGNLTLRIQLIDS